VLGEELVGDALREPGRGLGCDFYTSEKTFGYLRGRGDETETHSGGEHFGQGIKADNAAVDIHAEERWDETGEELLACRVSFVGRVCFSTVGFHLEEILD